MNLLEEIVIHDTLNPKLWDIENNKLRPEVREKIIKICEAFEEFIEVPIEICDIQLVGSNCSFNWHEGSDVDVCIVANFEAVNPNTDILQSYYWVEKTRFNDKYDIKIGGFDVELYVQDVKSGVVSNGIYSVCDDKWIKEPKPLKNVKNYDVSEALDKWQSKIQEILASGGKQEATNAINRLYLMRHNSIARDGEFGEGNQLYKALRNLGLIDALKEKVVQEQNKELSLEGLSKGQIVARY